MPARSEVHFDSHGTRCGAWHYLPDAPGPRPHVVMAHGLGATIELGLDAFARRFAAAGYGVFAFDYRGFGSSDGEPRQVVSIRRQLADWRAAIEHVRALPSVDRARIAIWGSSLGGGLAISTAAGDPELAAAIAQVPLTDGFQSLRRVPLATFARVTRAALADAGRALVGAAPRYVPLLGRPGDTALMAAEDCRDGYMRLVPPEAVASGRWRDRAAARLALSIGFYAPRRVAHRIRAPLLVIAARQDSIAPYEGAVATTRAAPRGELIEYDGGHFDCYAGERFERVVAEEVAFLDRHLGGAP